MPVVRVVAATAMPTLPNTWRTTLYKPAAAVILAFSIVPSAAVESATKIRLNPTPCHSCGTNTSQNPTAIVRCDSSWNENALTRSPAAISRRGPRRLYNSPPDRHHDRHGEAARHEREAGRLRGVAQQVLQEQWQQEQTAGGPRPARWRS